MREMLDSDEFVFRFEVGVIDAAAKLGLEDCRRIVSTISKYYTIVQAKAQLDQMVEGLNVLGVHDLMKLNPHAFRKLMIEPDVQINADYILNLFRTDFSDAGSNKRDVEEQAVIYWVNFIQLIECTFLVHLYCTVYGPLLQ
jgi:hypothetical protein